MNVNHIVSLYGGPRDGAIFHMSCNPGALQYERGHVYRVMEESPPQDITPVLRSLNMYYVGVRTAREFHKILDDAANLIY